MIKYTPAIERNLSLFQTPVEQELDANSILLQEQVEGYKALYGYYPELVLADRIYLNRENRKYLKNKEIRHSGKHWSYSACTQRNQVGGSRF